MLEAAMASGLVVGGLDLDYSAAESVSNLTARTTRVTEHLHYWW